MDLVSVVTAHTPLIHPADQYESENVPANLSNLPEIEQPALAWKRHWYGDRPIEHVMRATKPGYSIFPRAVDDPEASQCPIGFFPGWTWGYVFWGSEFYSRAA